MDLTVSPFGKFATIIIKKDEAKYVWVEDYQDYTSIKIEAKDGETVDDLLKKIFDYGE